MSIRILRFALLLAPSASAIAQQNLPRSSVDPLGGIDLTQMLLGLVAVLALIAVLAAVLRRYPNIRGGQGLIKVVAGLPLGSRERLLLVEVDEVRILVGVAPGQLKTLHVFDNAAGSAKASFAHTLNVVQEGRQSD